MARASMGYGRCARGQPALRARFALPTGCATVSALRALLVFSKLKIQKLVAVGGGGQREALSTGGGWAVL